MTALGSAGRRRRPSARERHRGARRATAGRVGVRRHAVDEVDPLVRRGDVSGPPPPWSDDDSADRVLPPPRSAARHGASRGDAVGRDGTGAEPFGRAISGAAPGRTRDQGRPERDLATVTRRADLLGGARAPIPTARREDRVVDDRVVLAEVDRLERSPSRVEVVQLRVAQPVTSARSEIRRCATRVKRPVRRHSSRSLGTPSRSAVSSLAEVEQEAQHHDAALAVSEASPARHRRRSTRPMRGITTDATQSTSGTRPFARSRHNQQSVIHWRSPATRRRAADRRGAQSQRV